MAIESYKDSISQAPLNIIALVISTQEKILVALLLRLINRKSSAILSSRKAFLECFVVDTR